MLDTGSLYGYRAMHTDRSARPEAWGTAAAPGALTNGPGSGRAEGHAAAAAAADGCRRGPLRGTEGSRGAGTPAHWTHTRAEQRYTVLVKLVLVSRSRGRGVAFELVVAVWLNAKPDKVRDVASVGYPALMWAYRSPGGLLSFSWFLPAGRGAVPSPPVTNDQGASRSGSSMPPGGSTLAKDAQRGEGGEAEPG